MIEVIIPGFKQLRLEHLVLDYNGTLAIDGELIAGVKRRLRLISSRLSVHVITADTFGKVRAQLKSSRCKLTVFSGKNMHRAKLRYIRSLGTGKTVCLGNGRNDRLMLKHSALGIAVCQEEGLAVEALRDANIICSNINDALDLLSNPLRLVATLRS